MVRADTRQKTDFDWKQIVEAGNVIAGSPATVRDRLREMIKSLRVGNITAHLNIGSMPHHLAVKNIELFSKEVMPYLHDIWDDQWPVVGWPEVANNRLNHAGLAQNSV